VGEQGVWRVLTLNPMTGAVLSDVAERGEAHMATKIQLPDGSPSLLVLSPAHGLRAGNAPLSRRRCSSPVLQQQEQQQKKVAQQQETRGVVVPTKSSDNDASADASSGFSYVEFAQQYPFANNVAIATVKTAAADLLAQTVIAGTPLDAVDWQRSLLFCLFGAVYLGGFQYFYQVGVFKRMFDVDSFTSQPWEDKLKDGPGLRALGAQTALDLTVLTLVYLPTFYIFKAAVFEGSLDPAAWASSGLAKYGANFQKDEFDLIRVWLPADLVCFSVPLYLRLPVRHVVSFVWTAYLSFARGGH